MVTQLCFNADTTVSWAQKMARDGIDLPNCVGVPGVVNRQKLIRIAARLGLGQSARFLSKQRGLLARFFLPGGYDPRRLVTRLAPSIHAPGANLSGLHVFTFNQLAETEAWRRNWLARIPSASPADQLPA